MPRIKRRHGLPYRRKKEGKTDYRLRLNVLKSGNPRLVIRKSLKNIYAQLISYHTEGDKALLSASTKELNKEYGWNTNRRNTPAAYLTGYLLAKKAMEKNIKEATADLGMQKAIKGSVLFAAIKGAVDGGLNVPHTAEVFPSDDRIQGKHLKTSPFKTVKENIEKKFK